jgi:hypothetical protein
MPRAHAAATLALAASLAAACSAAGPSEGSEREAPITSNVATFVEMEFDGEVVGGEDDDARKLVHAQLFYTVGDFTSFDANGRVGFVELSNVQRRDEAGGLSRVSYHAKLPVAWPRARQDKIPETYAIVVPLRADAEGQSAFNDAYDGKCGRNEYGRATFWHDFRPNASGCELRDADVLRARAAVRRAKNITEGRYPEYAEIWKDKRFEVVAFFGAADSTSSEGDIGVRQYERFLSGVRSSLPGSTLTENAKSDSIARDVTIDAPLAGGRTVRVTSLLVDTIFSAGADLEARYAPLSARADLVLYNGHSELSKNTKSLARRGTIEKGHYQLFVFNSCDTFAYLDTALVDRHREANGADDPTGTKTLDIVSNVLPSFFVNYADTSLSIYRALLDDVKPKTYNQILDELPSDQIVVVAGEEDNAFNP